MINFTNGMHRYMVLVKKIPVHQNFQGKESTPNLKVNKKTVTVVGSGDNYYIRGVFQIKLEIVCGGNLVL